MDKNEKKEAVMDKNEKVEIKSLEIKDGKLVSIQIVPLNEDKGCIDKNITDTHIYSVLKNLLDYVEIHTCVHENTHRGGLLWEICDDCGMKWADDEGGKPEYMYPKAILDAQELVFDLK